MSDNNSEKLSLAACVRKCCSYVKNIVSRMFKKNLTEEEMDRLRCLNDGGKTPDIVLSEELNKVIDDANKIHSNIWN